MGEATASRSGAYIEAADSARATTWIHCHGGECSCAMLQPAPARDRVSTLVISIIAESISATVGSWMEIGSRHGEGGVGT